MEIILKLIPANQWSFLSHHDKKCGAWKIIIEDRNVKIVYFIICEHHKYFYIYKCMDKIIFITIAEAINSICTAHKNKFTHKIEYEKN